VLAGIHAGDPEKLSLRSTFPQFAEMESRRGSVILALRGASTRPYSAPTTGRTMFMTLRGGLEELVVALVRRLGSDAVRSGAEVLSVRRENESYLATLASGENIRARALIVACGAGPASRMLAALDAQAARELGAIRFASTATVSLLYGESSSAAELSGFGFVVDRREEISLSAATYSSQKFPGKFPPGKCLIRCFMGGDGRESVLASSDSDLVERAQRDLRRILGIFEDPEAARVYRWPKSNPQYEVGHARRLERIEQRLKPFPGLMLIGSSYRGVGIPDCIRSGREAARRLARGESAGSIL